MSDALAPSRSVAPSTIQRLVEEMIALPETTARQLKFFDQSMRQTREETTANFNNFVNETTRVYQQTRQELHGEKRNALALQNEVLEIALDLARIMSAKPAASDANAMTAWA